MSNIKLYFVSKLFRCKLPTSSKVDLQLRLTEDVCENESYDMADKMYQKAFCPLYIVAMQKSIRSICFPNLWKQRYIAFTISPYPTVFGQNRSMAFLQ